MVGGEKRVLSKKKSRDLSPEVGKDLDPMWKKADVADFQAEGAARGMAMR